MTGQWCQHIGQQAEADFVVGGEDDADHGLVRSLPADGERGMGAGDTAGDSMLISGALPGTGLQLLMESVHCPHDRMGTVYVFSDREREAGRTQSGK